MASNDKIKLSQEWKQAFAQGEYQSFSQKVSLYDLLFYKNDSGQLSLRAGFSSTGENEFYGFKLKHSVIAVDTNYENKVDYLYNYIALDESATDEDIENSKKIKIEAALPTFDLRAKPQFITKDNASIFVDENLTSSSFEAALKSFMPTKLQESDYFYALQSKSTANYAPGIKVFNEEAVQNLVYADSFNQPLVFAIDSDLTNKKLAKDSTIDIVLCDEDTTFEKKFLQESSNLRAFSSVAINIGSSFWKNLFFNYYSFEKKPNLFTYSSDLLSVSLANTKLLQYLLKNCFILLKCPFFADYVDYKDFDQELSKTADVIHRNIMISASGDFERFDKLSDDSKDDVATSRPYLPTTIPSIDRFASSLLENSKLEDVIATAKKKDSNIGYLQTETFETSLDTQRSSTSMKDSATLAPLWFDPDSRSEASDYNDTPTFMPKNGNLYVDGRIISRSIDELWEAIKRIESGRDKDSNVSKSTELGYPTSISEENKTTSDTRPALKKMKFLDKSSTERIGDPTYITYSTSSSLTFTVKEWVNNPEKIQYNLMDEIKKLYGWDYSIEDSLVTVSKALSAIDTLEEYEPAKNPYTLRELESILRGLQYNLAYLIAYSKKNFVRTGKLGKVNNVGKYNETAGTLSQLHRDFQNDEQNKNTQYKNYESLSPIDNDIYGNDQNTVPSKSVYLSANGTWQSVYQFVRLRVRDDEEF